MATSPKESVSHETEPSDVFEWLAQCRGLIAPSKLAKRLDLSPKTIYAYAERDMIPYYKIESNVRFRPKDLIEWLASRRVQGGLTVPRSRAS